MRLGYIIIYVKSVPDTLAFYNKAFKINTRFCIASNEYGELDLEGSTLAFAEETFVEKSVGEFRPIRPDETTTGVSISLVVEDVEEVLKQAVDAGATLVKEPVKKPWGQTVSYVRDCNGFLVEICTKIGA